MNHNAHMHTSRQHLPITCPYSKISGPSLRALTRQHRSCACHKALLHAQRPCIRQTRHFGQARGIRPAAASASIQTPEKSTGEVEKANGILEGVWRWRDYNIRYQRCGTQGPAVLLIHGFGGNCDHWRKNIPVLAQSCQVHAIDLLGYGYSDKPDPRDGLPNAIYNFETWGQQAADYISERVKAPSVVVCNSVGGLAGLQAAQENTELITAVQVHNISLRMLHITKQNRLQRIFVARLQQFLRETRIGVAFFGAVAKSKAVRNVLRECYGDKNAVTDELVDFILKPGLEPGAAQVFLDFISYSGGPLPEDLIRDAPCPVSILWGDKDPWEKVEWGREFKKYDTVEEFIELPGVGHCPMDEAPDMVNPRMLAFIERHHAAA